MKDLQHSVSNPEENTLSQDELVVLGAQTLHHDGEDIDERAWHQQDLGAMSVEEGTEDEAAEEKKEEL